MRNVPCAVATLAAKSSSARTWFLVILCLIARTQCAKHFDFIFEYFSAFAPPFSFLTNVFTIACKMHNDSTGTGRATKTVVKKKKFLKHPRGRVTRELSTPGVE